MPDFHAIIPAGGVGSRLWPVSTQTRPKFLLDLNGRTMLEETIRRLAPLAQHITVVTGSAHRSKVEAIASAYGSMVDVIAEPSPKNSMGAIGLAAMLAYVNDPDCIVGSFAADHVIADQQHFEQRVQRAIDVAQLGYVVALGVKPRYGATEYGYCQRAGRLESVDFKAYELERFVEKPTLKRAKKYVASGRFFWNAGMYIAKASMLRSTMKRYNRDAYAMLKKIVDSWDGGVDAWQEYWERLPAEPIDTVIAEPAAEEGHMALVPMGNIGWDDIGDIAALLRISGIKGAATISCDAAGKVRVTPADDGDRNTIYIDTPDVQMTTSRTTLDEVRQMRK